ncbi:MAG: hypothetical protein M0002_07425 [Rhodospirillales bacterium]|nr:hypothetical protein [Rhodospirillales bacterium]
MPSPWPRAAFGFFAGAISVLTFHQGMWAILHGLGEMPPPFPVVRMPPLGVPLTLDLCFWGGVWAAAFGLVLPKLPRGVPMWLLGLGLAAALVSLFLVAPLKGQPIAGGFAVMAFVRSFLINGSWGIGGGLIMPLLLPRLVQSA